MTGNEPDQFLKRRLIFGFHAVRVQFDVRIHGLDVHLVGVAAEPVVLGIVAHTVLDNRFFELCDQRLIILGVDLDLQGTHVAAARAVRTNLNCTVGCKVPAELAEVFAVVVDQDHDGVARVLLHLVLPLALDGVKAVLHGAAARQQRRFVCVVLERDQRDALPVVRLLSCHDVRRGEWLDRCQAAARQREVVNAGIVIHLHAVHDLLGQADVLGHIVHADSRVKARVLLVRPQRDNFIGAQPPKRQSAVLVVIREQPADAAAQCVAGDRLDEPCELLGQQVRPQRVCKRLVFRANDKRLSDQIVGFLIDQLAELVVHNAAVRQIIQRNQLAVLTNSRTLLVQNGVPAAIVQVAVHHVAAAFRAPEPVDLLHDELRVRHALIGVFSAEGQQIVLVCLIELEHGSSLL